MATFLFDKIIFGPVKSRRLGVSLGINLMPVDVKVCSFDCIYCECGFTPKTRTKKAMLPSREEVRKKLDEKLHEMKADKQLPDVITFAGNGEPTLHPQFAGIIDDTIELRNQLAPDASIAVLSNSTMLHKPDVFNALLKIEDNILKLDSAFDETVNLINCPKNDYSLDSVVEQFKSFNGKVIVQTLFVKGSLKGVVVDNSTEKEVSAWLEKIQEIKPKQVMIYTIARDTPVNSLEKVSAEKLDAIAAKVEKAGFKVQVSY
ncbi:Wyosine [tRNA(Phe)-imidazoG37] synthetase, radical SAM superfamily [Mariniphaga anaerophila]|uniref:Wyosine [tRNA(Phe)-imidazoG37] synthetase, radical SAM superfamily n=1 Tax=Mariniphaga anaerophila TaxID=1484053 RepID=A0A1M5CM86_9BACT|nr:radical SAM protein [Mariniphaga anaerophila]SHF55819.1 Wyosine [tRNA(Phe)-imidazoG37] synthetase, radical SAM superfamily [Mariniphaga anaerophila]